MKITVLCFASLRERLGTGREEIELPEGVASVGALRAHLAARGGVWGEAFEARRLLRAARNQDMCDAGAPLADGDEIAFFPPVTGG